MGELQERKWTGLRSMPALAWDERMQAVALARQVVNPPNMPYPVGEDERYVAFTVVSDGGGPLATTARAWLTLVSTAFNNGFRLNHDNVARGDLGYTGKPYEGMTYGSDVAGEPPVLTARVTATITTGPIAGMRYRLLDWHFREIGAGTVGESLTISADQPVFTVELSR